MSEDPIVLDEYRPLKRWVIRCGTCGTKYKSGPRKTPPKNPICPNLDCGQVIPEQSRLDLSIAKAPAQIGQNPYVQAADKTADMVMSNYGMTDLQGGSTGLRPGDTMAPKLPPHLQQQADNFFPTARAIDGLRNQGPGLPAFDPIKAISSAMSAPPPHQAIMSAGQSKPAMKVIGKIDQTGKAILDAASFP